MINLFSSAVSIFNQYEYSDGTIVWYPHVLSNVHLETDRGQIMKKYGADSTDNAELYIAYTSSDGSRIVADSNGNSLTWLPPKEWAAQVNDDLANSITFRPGDFFMVGEWDGDSIINDEDYSSRLDEGFYSYMNRNKDYVFKITSCGIYNVIPHFELLGA